MKVIAKEAAELKKIEEQLRPVILEQIGQRREVLIDGQIRILEPGQTQSCKILDPAALLGLAQENGWKITQQEPEIVSAASARKYALEGQIPAEIVSVDVTPTVVVF